MSEKIITKFVKGRKIDFFLFLLKFDVESNFIPEILNVNSFFVAKKIYPNNMLSIGKNLYISHILIHFVVVSCHHPHRKTKNLMSTGEKKGNTFLFRIVR